jgi:hypothetical protein
VQLLDTLERLGEFPAEIWLIPPVLILAAIAAVAWLRRSLQLGRYKAVAERTRLTLVPKFFNPSEVRGSFRNRQLVMNETGRRRQTLFRKRWTQVVVDVTNPESIGFNIWRQDGIDRFILAVGGTEIVVGDAEFDRRFVIRSNDDDALVAAVFSAGDLRRMILDAKIEEMNLRHPHLFVYYGRVERDPRHAELLFTAATRLADAIDALKVDHKPEVIRTSRMF